MKKFARDYTLPNARGVSTRLRLECEGDDDAAASEHRKVEAALTTMGAVSAGPVERPPPPQPQWDAQQ